MLRLSPGEYLVYVLLRITGNLFRDKFIIFFENKSTPCKSLFDLKFCCCLSLSLLELSPLLFLFFDSFLFRLTECSFLVKLLVFEFCDIFLKLFFNKIYIKRIL